MYTCPMHPEIRRDKPGKCPICHMDLVKESKLDSYNNANSYKPLIVVISLILVTAILTSFNVQTANFQLLKLVENFMIGFFVVFAGFKLMDLKGFKDAYSTYDLLAKRVPSYGYIYPFIELFFGLSMIVFALNDFILIAEILVMTFSGIGVVIKILKKERFQCACLGTFLKVPLTKVTLVEDFGMAVLALILLLSTR